MLMFLLGVLAGGILNVIMGSICMKLNADEVIKAKDKKIAALECGIINQDYHFNEVLGEVVDTKDQVRILRGEIGLLRDDLMANKGEEA